MFENIFNKLHLLAGADKLDTDVATDLEAQVFNTTFRKFIWLVLQPLFYAFRPMVIYPKAVTDLELLNLLIQLVYDLLLLAIGGPRSLAYLGLSMWLGLSVHPLSGHFLSDHFVFEDGQETSSYYGPINLVTFNVGHHVEHHDFPFVPGCKLPLVRHILCRNSHSMYTDSQNRARILLEFGHT